MSNTKFIKVDVSKRLPIPFEDVRIITDLDEWGNGYCSENGNWWLHNKFDGKVAFFLEEVPDRESEFIEMLEEMISQFDWKDENDSNQQLSIDKAKNLIQLVKQPK